MLRNITWGSYIFFAAWLALGGIWVYFYIPETRGRTLEEMDAAFGSHTSQEDIEELGRVQEEVGLTALLEGNTNGLYDEKAIVDDEKASTTEHIEV